ncbi:MAG: hypothetical protein M3R68_00510, partial [Acidobacteriota bacterium]|nr:hypothetical protein [Acidobacteriota bacterium]
MQENSPAVHATAASQQAQPAPPQYADVALPVHVDQTFTYRLPDIMRDMAQRGARIVVPFGRKLLTGYIVDLRHKLSDSSTLNESEIKEAEELIDAVPLIAPDVLALTRWVSEYYAAPWGEVLKAALPPGITESIEQLLSLTAKGIEEAAQLQAEGGTTNRTQLLTLIAGKGQLSLRAAAGVLGQTQALNAARILERAGTLVITQTTRGATAKEKLQRAVRLIGKIDLSDTSLTQAQRRVIQTLNSV